MTASIPSDSFDAAAAYLSSSPTLSKVSNNVKLELYALFKCITVSQRPQTLRPSLFDFTGRAKWDAWEKLGKESDQPDPDIWKQRYLEIARSLGWQESSQHSSVEAEFSDESANDRGRGGGGGMGVSVSVISQSPPDPKDQGTLHASVLSNDEQELLLFLDANPDVDINCLDDYGYTPLHLAADRGKTSIVKILLDKGADTTRQDPDEFTALELAEVGGHEDIVEIIRTHHSP